LARNDSFGGSRQGSAVGSRKSKAEEDAEEFDALLDDITKPESGAKNAQKFQYDAPIATGTFRNSDNDAWEDNTFQGGG
jgi:hypothetical protein